MAVKTKSVSPKEIGKELTKSAIEKIGNSLKETVNSINAAVSVFRSSTIELMREYTVTIFPLYVKAGKGVYESGLKGKALEPFADTFLQCSSSNALKYKRIFLQRNHIQTLIDAGFVGALDKMSNAASAIGNLPEKKVANVLSKAVKDMDTEEPTFAKLAKSINADNDVKKGGNGQDTDEVKLSRTWLNKNNRDDVFEQLGLLLDCIGTDKYSDEGQECHDEVRQFIYDRGITKPSKNPKA